MHADTVPCLLELADEFDRVGNERDTSSDGSIGDQAHQERSSNHNRDDVAGSNTPQTDSDSSPDIRAIDVDQSGPWKNGFTMQKGVDFLVERCRSGVEDRLVEIIFNGHAWYRSNGWKKIVYTGSNQHTEHAHVGAKADSGTLENDRRPWGIAEKWGDSMSVQDVRDFFHGVAQAVTGDPAASSEDRADRNNLAAGLRYGFGLNYPDQTAEQLAPGRFNALETKVDELSEKLDQLLARE
jgi:hypothetical protein